MLTLKSYDFITFISVTHKTFCILQHLPAHVVLGLSLLLNLTVTKCRPRLGAQLLIEL